MSKLFKVCLLVMGLFLIAPWLDGGNHQVGAAVPPSLPPPTVVAIQKGLLGQPGQIGYGASYRVRYLAFESGHQELLGIQAPPNDDVSFFVHQGAGFQAQFLFGDALLAQIAATGQGFPDVTKDDFEVIPCRGGFNADGTCPNLAPVTRPKLECVEDVSRDQEFHIEGLNIFDYKFTLKKAVANPPALPARVDDIKVVFVPVTP